jgi:hypothetical protein
MTIRRRRLGTWPGCPDRRYVRWVGVFPFTLSPGSADNIVREIGLLALHDSAGRVRRGGVQGVRLRSRPWRTQLRVIRGQDEDVNDSLRSSVVSQALRPGRSGFERLVDRGAGPTEG